ncbi:hypothetical protein D3C73_1464480 [compost metagenome]
MRKDITKDRGTSIAEPITPVAPVTAPCTDAIHLFCSANAWLIRLERSTSSVSSSKSRAPA